MVSRSPGESTPSTCPLASSIQDDLQAIVRAWLEEARGQVLGVLSPGERDTIELLLQKHLDELEHRYEEARAAT